MAIMIPNRPRKCTNDSHEKEMFYALSKLPDEYIVIHSWRQIRVENNIISESQGDFVIYNKKKGIICLEAKSSGMYENGIWKYSSGIVMEHDGPYNQASDCKHDLINYIRDRGYGEILKRCKLIHAVWFFLTEKKTLQKSFLSQDASEEITLTKESLLNLQSEIDRIFSRRVFTFNNNEVITKLSDDDDKIIMDKILSPKFNLCSYKEIKKGHETLSFFRLEDEQKAILNYISEVNSAVIQGLGGTGKTVLAEEYAKRKSELGDKVLFLCYNKKIFKRIREIDLFGYPNIKVYNLDFLLLDYGIPFQAYEKFEEKLYEMWENNTFPYRHIVIDEGQDFGIIDPENASSAVEIENARKRVHLISTLKDIVTSYQNGTFYIFYDKHQMVQSDVLPDYILNADTKLTLYKNCRNTAKIAETSIKFLSDVKMAKLKENFIEGESPELYFEGSEENVILRLDQVIDYIKREICDANGIVILTCFSENNTIVKNEIISDRTGDYYYKTKTGDRIMFTTASKFKGLEAEAIIIVDVNYNALHDKRKKLYVASSRAKRRLFFISTINEDECRDIIIEYGGKAKGDLEHKIKNILCCKIE